jgi:hypothetical protein
MDNTPHLEITAIESGSPKDVAVKAWYAILAKLKNVRSHDLDDTVKTFPQGWRATYTTFWLQCEVNNGGHHQFFWNSEGALNEVTEQDLELIGATPFLKLFREAKKIFEAHDYAKEKASSGNSWHGFTEAYREKRMEELDDQFYKEAKQIEDYLGDFIQRNPNLFTR